MEKLFVVIRADLPAGDVATQACHALSSFAVTYPELHARWHEGGKNLVLLAIPNEQALGELMRVAAELGLCQAAFHEPDLSHQLTACAFEYGVRKLVSSLPLALRAPKLAA